MDWGWPQWVLMGLLAFNLVVHISKHGEDRGQHSGPVALIDGVLTGWILYMGGFWTP